MAVISAIVRGGGTKPAGSAPPRLTTSFFALPLSIATATLARPLALFSAAIVQARTDGEALARHFARFDSLSPLPRRPCMQGCTMAVPTVWRQFAFACSIVSALAACGDDSNATIVNAPKI